MLDEDTVIESLMAYYKDFNYVTYILHCDFGTGYKLFIKMIKEKAERLRHDRLWDLYLIETQNGYKGDFDSYVKISNNKREESNMTRLEKNREEDRIKDKYKNLHKKNMKKRGFKL